MIKQLIAGALILGSLSCSFAAVSFQQAKEVFNELYNVSGRHAKLHYDSTLNVNAWMTFPAHGYKIVITQGMLNTLQNKDELAMVLGHEIGHKALSHYRPVDYLRQEMDADDVGYYYCKKAGYKRCIDGLKVLQAKFGDGTGADGVHPPWSVRIKGVLRHK